MEDYIQKLQIRKLTKEESEVMEKAITQEEILNTIDLTKMGKALGPDKYTAKLYKNYKNEVVQWFRLVANNIMEGGTILGTWQEATITMIPKEEHKCPDVKNFRPISLLNSDYKIFAK